MKKAKTLNRRDRRGPFFLAPEARFSKGWTMSEDTFQAQVPLPASHRRLSHPALRYVPLFLSALALAVSSYAVYYGGKLKQLDVMLQCQSRYERVAFELKHRANHEAYDPMEFYVQFWNLQIDQHRLWLEGFIPDATYAYWLFCRHNEWQENDPVGSSQTKAITYKDGFEEGARRLHVVDTPFYNDMKRVFAGEHWLLVKKYPESMKRNRK